MERTGLPCTKCQINAQEEDIYDFPALYCFMPLCRHINTRCNKQTEKQNSNNDRNPIFKIKIRVPK